MVTLMTPLYMVAVVPSSLAVPESMNRDLNRVSEWCDFLGIILDRSKTKTTIVSRSRTVHPHMQAPTINLGGTVLKESADLDILGVTVDAKMTFAKHHRDF